MQLIEDLEATLVNEESYFRQHLVKEDIARLETLTGLVLSATDRGDFLTKGVGVGWTQNDMRTHQIKDAVQAFLSEMYDYETGSKSPEDDAKLRSAWHAFDTERMEKLIRCL